MPERILILRGLCAFALLALTPLVPAADFLVGAGQTYASVSAALTAAGNGDTIIIKDSGVYDEPATVTINKQVAIVAEPGQNPTIRFTGATGTVGFLTAAGAGGGRIGSIGGGKINIDRNMPPTSNVGGAVAIGVAGIAAAETYTLENLYITGFVTNAVHAAGVRGTLNFNVVEIDRKYTDAHRLTFPIPTITSGIRILSSTVANATNFGATFNFTRVSVHNVDSHAIIFSTSSNQILDSIVANIDTCEFTTLNHGALIMNNCSNVTMNITNTFLQGGGGARTSTTIPVVAHSTWGALRYSFTTATATATHFAGGNVNVTNSVIALEPGFGTQSVVDFPGGTLNSNNINLTIDHCDIVAPLGATAITTDSIRSRRAFTFGASTNRNVTLTNSNIFGPEFNDAITTPARIAGLLMATGSTGTNNIDYNNLWVSDYPTSGVVVGNHEVTPARDPLYTDRTNRDFRYTDPIILTASDTGGPLGVNSIMANIVPVELSSFGLN